MRKRIHTLTTYAAIGAFACRSVAAGGAHGASGGSGAYGTYAEAAAAAIKFATIADGFLPSVPIA